MIRILYCILFVVFFCSCNDKKIVYPYNLQPVDSLLNFDLDSDTKVPLMIRTCKADREYLYFQNDSRPELIIYDIYSGSVVKKNIFEIDGSNAIKGGFLNGFMMLDCDRIFVSGLADGHIYETDTTGRIKYELVSNNRQNGYNLLPCFKDNGTMQLIDGKLYLPQSLNWQLEGNVIEKSPLLSCVDISSGEIMPLPINFPSQLAENRIVRGTPNSIVSEYKCCYTGRYFVYSFAYMEELMVVDPINYTTEYKGGKSLYVDKIQIPSLRNMDDKYIQRKICESPAYGNIIYDNENKIYYRIVYVPQETEKNENMLALLRSGRKQFSIMIYDEHFNIIGEHLFPSYLYNPRLCFVSNGNLYISINHVKNPDYNDDILSFQKMQLIKNNVVKQ